PTSTLFPYTTLFRSAINDPFKESWRQAPDNQTTQFLSVDQCLATIKALRSRLQVLELASDMTIAARWREYRDMTIVAVMLGTGLDRKSTRLNSSHVK